MLLQEKWKNPSISDLNADPGLVYSVLYKCGCGSNFCPNFLMILNGVCPGGVWLEQLLYYDDQPRFTCTIYIYIYQYIYIYHLHVQRMTLKRSVCCLHGWIRFIDPNDKARLGLILMACCPFYGTCFDYTVYTYNVYVARLKTPTLTTSIIVGYRYNILVLLAVASYYCNHCLIYTLQILTGNSCPRKKTKSE